MTWTNDVENAVKTFFLHVVEERTRLASDLTLSSPERERHAVARDLAQDVVDTIAPEEKAPEPAAGDQGTPADSGQVE